MKKRLNVGPALKPPMFVPALLCLLLLLLICLQFIYFVSPLQGLLAKQAQLNYDVQGVAKKKTLKMTEKKKEKTKEIQNVEVEGQWKKQEKEEKTELKESVFEGRWVGKRGGGAGVAPAPPTCQLYRCWWRGSAALHSEENVRQAEQVAKAAEQRRLVKLSSSWSLLHHLHLHLLHVLHLHHLLMACLAFLFQVLVLLHGGTLLLDAIRGKCTRQVMMWNVACRVQRLAERKRVRATIKMTGGRFERVGGLEGDRGQETGLHTETVGAKGEFADKSAFLKKKMLMRAEEARNLCR